MFVLVLFYDKTSVEKYYIGSVPFGVKIVKFVKFVKFSAVKILCSPGATINFDRSVKILTGAFWKGRDFFSSYVR
jgi:hypothetical protein